MSRSVTGQASPLQRVCITGFPRQAKSSLILFSGGGTPDGFGLRTPRWAQASRGQLIGNLWPRIEFWNCAMGRIAQVVRAIMLDAEFTVADA